MIKGSKMSVEQRIKISNSLEGHKVKKITRQRIGKACKGNHPIMEFKEGHSKPKNAYSFPKGSNHPNWKGGSDTYLSVIAKAVVKKFNLVFVCKRCGSSNKIVIHHKDKNRKNNNLENLEILCMSCHISLHKKGIPWKKSLKS